MTTHSHQHHSSVRTPTTVTCDDITDLGHVVECETDETHETHEAHETTSSPHTRLIKLFRASPYHPAPSTVLEYEVILPLPANDVYAVEADDEATYSHSVRRQIHEAQQNAIEQYRTDCSER